MRAAQSGRLNKCRAQNLRRPGRCKAVALGPGAFAPSDSLAIRLVLLRVIWRIVPVSLYIGKLRSGFNFPVPSKDGPAFMIPPAAADLQIAPRIALAQKPGPLHQRNRGRVPRLNVCLQPVQFQMFEGVAKNELESIGHITLTGVACADVIAEESVLKTAAKNLAQVDGADNCALGCETNEKAD